MSIYTREFSSAAEYDEWQAAVGARVEVLHIEGGAQHQSPTARQLGHRVVVKYRTDDPSLAPPRGKAMRLIQTAIIGAIFFSLFLYVIGRINSHPAPPQLLRLDQP